VRLGERDHGLLALWAADCAECVLPCFEEKYPQDDRPRRLSRHARRCRGPHRLRRWGETRVAVPAPAGAPSIGGVPARGED